MAARVDLETDIVSREITLRDIVDLKVGDVIPVEMPNFQVVTANGVPMFRSTLGQSRGNLALKINDFIDRSNAFNIWAAEGESHE